MSSSTLKTLKVYATDLKDFGFAEIRAHIKDESDRASVIILTALLEGYLERCLRKRVEPNLGKTACDNLLKFNGPLGTFSARIAVAYAFDSIERETSNQLHNLREIRNACAHSQKSISFEVKELGDAIRLFTEGVDSFHGHWSKKRQTTDTRTKLTLEVLLLSSAIERGSRAAAIKVLDDLVEAIDTKRSKQE